MNIETYGRLMKVMWVIKTHSRLNPILTFILYVIDLLTD